MHISIHYLPSLQAVLSSPTGGASPPLSISPSPLFVQDALSWETDLAERSLCAFASFAPKYGRKASCAPNLFVDSGTIFGSLLE